MSAKNDIKNAIRGIMDTSDNEIYSVLCKVADVDLTNMTCDCVPIDTTKPNILDVNLVVNDEDGVVHNTSVIIPKIDSLVFVTMLSNEDAYVAMFSEVEVQNLNGDSYGGLIIIQKLVDDLNNFKGKHNDLETAFNNHITTYNIHTHVGVTTGSGTSGITTPDTPANVTVQQTHKSDLENTTVNHGDGN